MNGASQAVTKSHILFNEEDTTRVPGLQGSAGAPAARASRIAKAVIELRDVKFAYPTRLQAQVLNGVSFRVEEGSTVAIVGASGCGKSTILHLLQKNYPIQGGEVLIGGTNINDMDTESLRSQLATVPQEPKLFNRSIRDNIAYRPQEAPVTIEAVQAAAKAAKAHAFVQEIQNAYDFVVGKFGGRVSGGQRQRIAIARSLFASKDAKILLLDEATSALDNESERLVQAALEDFQKGRTTIIVAHRLSTIKAADNILVMKDGKVVEQGTFQDLVANKGQFYEFYKDEV